MHLVEKFEIKGVHFKVYARDDGGYQLVVHHSLNSLVNTMLSTLGVVTELDVERMGRGYQVSCTVGRDVITDHFETLDELIRHVVENGRT